MKYRALVAACLLTITLGVPLAGPAVADDPDPVQVTFPPVTELNPAHTPYVVEVHDPAPERGDLVVAVNGTAYPLPHEGSATVPLDDVSAEHALVRVQRCAAPDSCVDVTNAHLLRVFNHLALSLDADALLGPRARLPLAGISPAPADGDVVQLSWRLTDDAGAELTAGSDAWVVGQPLPSVGIPGTTDVTEAQLSLHAVGDSVQWGHLEGGAARTYAVDLDAPQLSLSTSGNRVFPVRDRYLDSIDIWTASSSEDVSEFRIDLESMDGTVRNLYRSKEPDIDTLRFNGWDRNRVLAPGAYVIRATVTDRAGNVTDRSRAVTIDGRTLVKQTYRATIPAARTLADRYVGACSHLGPAAGRGWKGSLGLYSSTPCARKNGSVVITVHGAQVPASVGRYPGKVQVSLYGGAARGSGRAYVVHGWLGAADNEFLGRRELDGRLGSHRANGVSPQAVVRTIDGRQWVYWQLGLTDGSRYDVKSFTISAQYYALVPPASRTANDAKTIAEPSGAPGPGYTAPKTDAAELLEAYKPAM